MKTSNMDLSIKESNKVLRRTQLSEICEKRIQIGIERIFKKKIESMRLLDIRISDKISFCFSTSLFLLLPCMTKVVEKLNLYTLKKLKSKRFSAKLIQCSVIWRFSWKIWVFCTFFPFLNMKTPGTVFLLLFQNGNFLWTLLTTPTTLNPSNKIVLNFPSIKPTFFSPPSQC